MTSLEQALSEIPSFSLVHEHLFSSAQPTAEQLQQIKEYGCSTVINLATSKSENHLAKQDQICFNSSLVRLGAVIRTKYSLNKELFQFQLGAIGSLLTPYH